MLYWTHPVPAVDYPGEIEQLFPADPGVIPFNRGQVVELLVLGQFLTDVIRRESLVIDKNAPGDLVVPYEGTVGDRVDAVPGEYLRTDRFLLLYVVGIQYRDVLASLQPCLIGECGKIVDPAAVLFQHAVRVCRVKLSRKKYCLLASSVFDTSKIDTKCVFFLRLIRMISYNSL